MTIKNSKYYCDICGAESETWGQDWTRYGSIQHLETCPGELPMACSERCRDELMDKIKRHEKEWILMDNRTLEHKLMVAVEEAERFIMKAKTAIHALKSYSYAQYGCKETGAAKRASMDLTRALADMRRR